MATPEPESEPADPSEPAGPAESTPDGGDNRRSRLAVVGIAVSMLFVFGTWTRLAGVSLNGTQGSNNGWALIVFGLLALPAAHFIDRRSLLAPVAVLLYAYIALSMSVGVGLPAGVSRQWGMWASALGATGAGAVAVPALWHEISRRRHTRHEPEAPDAPETPGEPEASETPDAPEASEATHGPDAPEARVAPVAASTDEDELRASSGPRLRRPRVAEVVFVIAIVLFVAWQQVLLVSEPTSWPPPSDAVAAADAQEVTEAFVSDDPRPLQAGLPYAWSTAATIEPWPEGTEFFPRIFADIEAAESSIHIVMFGWNSTAIGVEMRRLIEAKLAEGVEVRILVDAYGSDPFGEHAAIFESMAENGAQIAVNDVMPFDSDGPIGARSFDWRQDEVGHAEHRKLYVIDGAVAWTGGAGVEEHFRNGGFHDVMVRVTGDVVLQLQSVFLTSFASHDMDLPEDLTSFFPDPVEGGDLPTVVLQVVPGGLASATQATRQMIDTAEQRLDIMNPYLTDRDIIERIINAAERGVDVRLVVSERSNNEYAEAIARHHYGALLDAGVEIWEYPGAVVHAKVIVADDSVQFGTLNLDAWALYRDFELALWVRDTATADVFEERLFEPDIARSQPGTPPTGMSAIASWVMDKVAYFL